MTGISPAQVTGVQLNDVIDTMFAGDKETQFPNERSGHQSRDGIDDAQFADEPVHVETRLGVGGIEIVGDESEIGEGEGHAAEVHEGEQRGTSSIEPVTVNGRSWTSNEIKAAFRKLCRWQNIFSLLLVTGSVRFSVQQFEIVRGVINTLLRKSFPGESLLPAYTTVERSLLPLLHSWGFLQSEMKEAGIDASKSGARVQRGQNDQKSMFTVVTPSSWSMMEVACPQTWKILKKASIDGTTLGSLTAFSHIEKTPIVWRRNEVLDALPLMKYPFCNHSDVGCLYAGEGTVFMYKIFLGEFQLLPDQLKAQITYGTEGSAKKLKPIRSAVVLPAASRTRQLRVPLREIKRGSLSLLSLEIAGLWVSGDLCTAMDYIEGSQYLLVLVHHQVRPGCSDDRVQLVCIPFSTLENDDTCVLRLSESITIDVVELSLTKGACEVLNFTLRNVETPSTVVESYGRLKNGTRYFIDHILLYSDGFKQYQFRQGSAGGIYCVSLNYPPHLRRSRDRVRVLGLTPPGISTAEGLRSIIDDLVTSCTEGVLVRNADGEDMVLFLDVVAFICDYHEIGSVLDVVGQNGNAPCHLCSFLRYKPVEIDGTRYGSTTAVHSGNPCYTRTGSRTKALRASCLDDDVLVSLGLNPEDQAEEKQSPLIEFYEVLMEKLKTTSIPLSEHDVPVLNPRFDPYRSVVVAPDHLLAGIAINELTLAFKVLPNPRRRKQFDFMICSSLRKNAVLTESKIFNFSNNALYKTSISGTFSILLLAAPIFHELVENLSPPGELNEEQREILRSVAKNLQNYRKLVSDTYWYPTLHVDDPESVAEFNEKDGAAHISALQRMCVDYIEECNAICLRCPLAMRELDKPNLHRLLELYMHSIPSMGHIHHFAELLFECAHQPLERSMTRSNFRDSHMQSMKHTIADDWKRRMAAAFPDKKGAIDAGCSERSILNLFCGRHPEVRSCIEQDLGTTETTWKLLQNDVLRTVLQSTPNNMDCREVTTIWYATDRSDELPIHQEVKTLVEDFLLVHQDADSPKFYKNAKRVKVWGTGTSQNWSHPRSHDKVTTDTAIQCLVYDASSVIPDITTDHIETEETSRFLCLFVIEALFSVSNGSCYAAVRRCTTTNDDLLTVEIEAPLQLVKMTDACRRIGIVHACHSDTILSCLATNGDDVTCAASLTNGNLFHYFTRKNGYPPRMA